MLDKTGHETSKLLLKFKGSDECNTENGMVCGLYPLSRIILFRIPDVGLSP
jgi:hypothetical protein